MLGTHNRKKARELRELLEPLGIEVVTLAETPNAIEVDETGRTFLENAELKAVQQARHLREWVLGEDSGLEVDALDGAPGVHSARYSGANAANKDHADEENNSKLLRELDTVPSERRGARFQCAMVLADPTGQIKATATGDCRGAIRREPRGEHGFGYDPLFEIPEYHRTFAELGPTAKAFLSHRARALRDMLASIQVVRASEPHLVHKSK